MLNLFNLANSYFSYLSSYICYNMANSALEEIAKIEQYYNNTKIYSKCT